MGGWIEVHIRGIGQLTEELSCAPATRHELDIYLFPDRAHLAVRPVGRPSDVKDSRLLRFHFCSLGHTLVHRPFPVVGPS